MLSSADFIQFILNGGGGPARPVETPGSAALPEGFEGFDAEMDHVSAGKGGTTSFARRLLEAAGFGLAQLVERNSVIRSSDAVARFLPDRASYWPKTATRPYQTLLFEASMTSGELLKIPAFRNTELRHLDDLEAALARLVSEALNGFQKGGEGVTADVRKGRKDETLCIISILDQREGESVRLVCFGTQNKQSEGLETFQITEQTRFWDPQLAREHLGLLYERQFRKLAGADWQDAFTTTEERKQAEKILDVCTRKSPKEHDIQESVLELLDIIAKGFGLRKKPKTERRLQAFELPSDHDIGIDPEELESSFGGKNPFGGVTLRDERSRLLGYIVYPLKTKADAARLRKHLRDNNRFHNVLVVYPDEDQASLELWQGREQLTGKLRKGHGYKDAADVVNLLSRFFVVSKAKVKNPTELAQELAYRARYLYRLALRQLGEEAEKGPLRNLYNAFKEALIHDQEEKDFASAFAQTITYGLLTARWTGNDQLVADGARLTRQTALKYLPAASPFLNDLFKSILSVRLDEQRGRFLWLVDDIADLLDRIDVSYVFGTGDAGSDKATDPVIHFYEPFLAAYDKELKNKRGVFFTPRPVVSYIVHSVHELLQKEFGLEDGLASTDTWGDVAKRIDGLKVPDGVKANDPFVCILDPATGTGTFLFECIEVVERTMKERWCRELKTKDRKNHAVVARWNAYVPKHLLPRLYGFELMMAPYAIAHLKLSFKLSETGYHLHAADRLHVHLTNTLEAPSSSANPKLAGLFVTLAHEAQEVDKVKRSHRFTVAVGNPPYSASVSDPQWLLAKMDTWKQGLNETKIDLNREEWKFVRFAQLLAEKVPCFIWGYIVNRDFLDGIAKRRMRESLQGTFPTRVVVDLNGDVKGNIVDENVFDITQGVCIAIGCRGGAGGEQRHRFTSLVGSRSEKYALLAEREKLDSALEKHLPSEPYFRWIPFRDAEAGAMESDYRTWLPLNEVFTVYSSGIQTKRDALCVQYSKSEMWDVVRRFHELDAEKARREFDLGEDGRDWTVLAAKKDIADSGPTQKHLSPLLYRPFDVRFTYWTGRTKGFLAYPRREVMQHVIDGDNIGLIFNRQIVGDSVSHFGVSRIPICHGTFYLGNKGQDYFGPLHVTESGLLSRGKPTRRANLTAKFLSELRAVMGSEPGPEEAFHYLFGIFHSQKYRERYGELLKQDFPRVPLTANKALSGKIAALGAELVTLHLMESPKVQRHQTTLVGAVGCEVKKIVYDEEAETIWIDKRKTVGFKGVKKEVWHFGVGGYQVCEKWLKDRKDRRLSKEDIAHYQSVIVALAEIRQVMAEVDSAIDKYGGWPGAFVTKAAGLKK